MGPIPPGYRFAGKVLEEPLPGGSLYDCMECGLSFRWPMPSAAQLNHLYQQAAETNWQYDPVLRCDWEMARSWIEEYQQGGSVLDIGCFDGAFLNTLDPAWDRYGIEINEQAAQRASQHDVTILAQDAGALPTLEHCFEAVTAFDLIEHVPDPRHLLEQMASLTVPGGILVVATGNRQAVTWRLLGSRYWYCWLPEHLVFISEAWCKKAAEALELTLLDVQHFSHNFEPTPRLVASEAAKNLLYRFLPPVFHAMRAAGMGDVDTSGHPNLKQAPPMWTTARDHLIAIFRKP